ncbi:MAG: hypothetical protein HZB55_20310 [Deltaproteobacteria bacterium]|nr:hypothetical protein [Deltaproteobacteria bacterium]
MNPVRARKTSLASRLLLSSMLLLAARASVGAGQNLAAPHLDLTVVGVDRATFRCPEPSSPLDRPGEAVVFVPQDGDGPVSVLLDWAAASRPGSRPAGRIQVSDACSEGLVHERTGRADPAVARLPLRAEGYAVYAVATPGVPESAVLVPDAPSVLDADGSTLVFLGFVSPHGARSADGLLLSEAARSAEADGRGRTDLAPLLEWTGSVCYPPAEAGGRCAAAGDPACVAEPLCCADADSDGVPEWCHPLASPEARAGLDGPLTCPEAAPGEPATAPVVALCRPHRFEALCLVPELAGRLCSVGADGSFTMRVRLYPAPTPP